MNLPILHSSTVLQKRSWNSSRTRFDARKVALGLKMTVAIARREVESFQRSDRSLALGRECAAERELIDDNPASFKPSQKLKNANEIAIV